MKRTPLPIAIILLMVSCSQGDSKRTITGNPFNTDSIFSDSTSYTSIQWLDSTHQELGKIKEGQTPEITWKFKNTGDKPLIVMNAQGTCGCTVAEKPLEPVPPGEEGIIKAKFSSEGRVGVNEKQVMVTTNTKGRTHHSLNFKVEVEKK
jgi:hypothetical protein